MSGELNMLNAVIKGAPSFSVYATVTLWFVLLTAAIHSHANYIPDFSRGKRDTGTLFYPRFEEPSSFRQELWQDIVTKLRIAEGVCNHTQRQILQKTLRSSDMVIQYFVSKLPTDQTVSNISFMPLPVPYADIAHNETHVNNSIKEVLTNIRKLHYVMIEVLRYNEALAIDVTRNHYPGRHTRRAIIRSINRGPAGHIRQILWAVQELTSFHGIPANLAMEDEVLEFKITELETPETLNSYLYTFAVLEDTRRYLEFASVLFEKLAEKSL